MQHVKSSMMRLFGAETGFDMCRYVFGGYSLWIALAKIVWDARCWHFVISITHMIERVLILQLWWMLWWLRCRSLMPAM